MRLGSRIRRPAAAAVALTVLLPLVQQDPAQAQTPVWSGFLTFSRAIDHHGAWGCNATDGDVVGDQHTVWNESWTVEAAPTPASGSGTTSMTATITGSVSYTVTSGCTYVDLPSPTPTVYTGSYSGTAPALVDLTEGSDGTTAVAVTTYGTGFGGSTVSSGPNWDHQDSPGQYWPRTTSALVVPTDSPVGSGAVSSPPNWGGLDFPVNLLNEGLATVTAGGSLTAVLSRTDPVPEAELPPPVDCREVLVPASLTASPSEAFDSSSVAFTAGQAAPGSRYLLDPGDGTGPHEMASSGPFTHTYAEPGEYAATLVVTDPSGCSATATTPRFAANPVLTYAPNVHFHPQERFFPDTASNFLARSQLVYYAPPECGTSKYLAAGVDAKRVGKVRQPQLIARYLAGKGSVYVGRKREYVTDVRGTSAGAVVTRTCVSPTGSARSNGNPTKPFVRRENDTRPGHSGFYLNLLDRASWRKGAAVSDTGPTPLYVDYDPGRYVAYWLFYPYNKWTGNGLTEIHEGDWEHIVVRLTEDTHLARAVGYYQHNCAAKTYPWPTKNRTLNQAELEDTTHPVLFSALGGHASYSATPGWIKANTLVKNCSVTLNTTLGPGADRIGSGKVWRPWKADRVQDVARQEWYGFGGSWGDRSSTSTPVAAVDNYGPPAPGPHNRGIPRGW